MVKAKPSCSSVCVCASVCVGVWVCASAREVDARAKGEEGRVVGAEGEEGLQGRACGGMGNSTGWEALPAASEV